MSTTKARDKQESGEHPAAGANPTEPAKAGVRAQILAAATALAKEKGAAHIAIEAIAQRAGVSKGGLLYHFPKKAALIQALVELHLAEIEATLADDVETSSGQRQTNAVARAFIELNRDHVCNQKKGMHGGILLAFAENPHLLDPMRSFEKRLVERIRRTAADRELSLLAMLVIQGMRSLNLFEANPLADDECRAVLDRVLTLLDADQEITGESRTA